MLTSLFRVFVAIIYEQFDILNCMARIQRRLVSSFICEFLDTAMLVLRVSLPILEAREKILAEQPKALQEAAAGFLEIFQGIDFN